MRYNEKIEAIILGINYANTLGMVKSVGEAGYSCGLIHHTSILKKKMITPDMASRYVCQGMYVDRKNDTAILSALLENFLPQAEDAVLLAADDYSASFLDRFHDELSEHYRVMQWESGPGMLTRYMDKRRQKKAAQAVDFPVAQNWSVAIPASKEELQLPQEIIYPCITKPEISAGSGMSKELISVCRSKEELEEYFAQVISAKASGSILVEEFLDIEEEYTIPGARLDDEVIIPAFVRKLETGKGKVRGLTVLGVTESTDTNPELRQHVEALVRHMGLSGIFDVEIIKCRGDYYFNEINLRSSAATYAITASGANIPAIFIEYMLGKDWKSSSRVSKENMTFVNEKPALQCYVQKDYSLEKYRALCQNADIRLLTGEGDAPSKEAFLAKEHREFIKRRYPLHYKLYEFFRDLKRGVRRKLRRKKRHMVSRLKRGERFLGSEMLRTYFRVKAALLFRFRLRISEVTDPSEFPELDQFLTRTFRRAMAQDEFEFTNSSDFTKSFQHILESGGKIFALRDRDELVGTIAYQPREQDWEIFEGEALQLKHLAMAPKYSGQGYGKRMISLVREAAAQRQCPVVLGTPVKNKKAVGLYTSCGFVPIKVFFSGNHYAVRMIRWKGKAPVSSKACRAATRKSALLCLMKYWKRSEEVVDGKVMKAWNNDFRPYLTKAPKKTQEDMRQCFDRYGVTPRKYVDLGFAEKDEEQRAASLTETLTE